MSTHPVESTGPTYGARSVHPPKAPGTGDAGDANRTEAPATRGTASDQAYTRSEHQLTRALAGAVWRNNLRLRRNTASLVSAFVIPGLFMLSFWSVFGHAAATSGFDYALFLMAACMIQAVMFTAGGSTLALAVDMENGLLSRMRAMPINAIVAVGGRLITDLIRSLCSLATVVALGLVCGAQPDGVSGLILGFGIVLVMGEVMALAFCGIALRSSHPVQTAGLLQAVEMPLLVFSTAFIPVALLPSWLRPVVEHLPFSPLIDTTRALLAGTGAGSTGWEALAWLVAGLVLGSLWVAHAFRRQR
ncbi:ABC transporter [Actinobaculum sp. 313]|nr:ABC transporter [Actinobaculum sp. 313]